jgi:hypothetical protein
MGEASGSKLPPGGAWELVDPVVEDAEDMPPIKAGKEAIREDANEILRGMSKHKYHQPILHLSLPTFSLAQRIYVFNRVLSRGGVYYTKVNEQEGGNPQTTERAYRA